MKTEKVAVTYGSVCSGIEAASVAWAPLGWRAAWLSEIDFFPSAVLAHRFPEVMNLGDMTKIPELVASGDVSAPDVLVGGTPCQAFSVAGMRAGLRDPRGQLTIKFVEIADAIDDVRRSRDELPAIIVWENVPGVLSDKGNAFGCFLGALAGEDCELKPPGKRWSNAGCVFGPARAIAWRVLDAQYFGVAQRRRRVFVVASARTGFDPSAILFEFDGMRRDTPPQQGEEKAPSADASIGAGASCGCWWDGGQISQTLDAVLAKGQMMPEKNRFPAVLHPTDSGMAVRRLTPRECERLQGFPDDWTLVPVRGKLAADSPRYKAIGNSMAVPVMRWIGRRIDRSVLDGISSPKYLAGAGVAI